MRTFVDWLLESSEGERLEAAVREYLAGRPEAKRCYYVTRPKNPNFNPSDPKQVEDELGPGYDRNLEVVPFKHHPSSFTCVSEADGLAEFLRKRGFKARKVAGWYGNAERGYSAGYTPSLHDDHPSPPRGFGSNPQQHWWVEVGNYVIDVTSAQFHPTNPKDQAGMVVRDKGAALYDGSYMAVRRFPLGRAVRLPPNATKMVEKILSLKKFARKHSSVPSENDELCDWIMRNRERFSMSLARAQDVVAAIRAQTRPGFHFADRRMLERAFGEAFDDLDEDEELKRQDENPSDFVAPKDVQRGTVRLARSRFGSRLVLSSVYGEEIESNMEVLKDLLKTKVPGVEFGETERHSENSYGNTVHYASAKVESDVDLSGLGRELKSQGFRLG